MLIPNFFGDVFAHDYYFACPALVLNIKFYAKLHDVSILSLVLSKG
jgi:hypothetical protein